MALKVAAVCRDNWSFHDAALSGSAAVSFVGIVGKPSSLKGRADIVVMGFACPFQTLFGHRAVFFRRFHGKFTPILRRFATHHSFATAAFEAEQ
jgi:hypothetical protein